MRRILIWAAAALVLVVGAAMFTIDSIARSAIETGVETALGVSTDVGSVRLRLFLGSFRMNDLEIANAEGYESDHFVELGTIETKISYADLRAGDVVLERLLLEDLVVALEWQGRKANYQAILGGTGSGKPEPAEPDAEPATESETRFIIDELVVRNVEARLSLDSALGKLNTTEVKIPEIKLKGIGRKSGGVDLAELTREVTTAIVGVVLKQGKTLGPEFSSKIGSGLKGLGSEGESAGKKLEETGQKLLRGLGDAFKRGD
jgi:uncharacterized protein involved in outer membrane biogenesis